MAVSQPSTSARLLTSAPEARHQADAPNERAAWWRAHRVHTEWRGARGRPLREEGKPRGRRGVPLPRTVHAVDRYRDGTRLTYDAARARIQGFWAVPAQGE